MKWLSVFDAWMWVLVDLWLWELQRFRGTDDICFLGSYLSLKRGVKTVSWNCIGWVCLLVFVHVFAFWRLESFVVGGFFVPHLVVWILLVVLRWSCWCFIVDWVSYCFLFTFVLVDIFVSSGCWWLDRQCAGNIDYGGEESIREIYIDKIGWVCECSDSKLVACFS